MPFKFQDSYDGTGEFLSDYVYEHLIMYPLIVILLTIIVVIFVRVKSHSIIKSRFFKHRGYYNRFHYGGLRTVTISAAVAVCILLLIGILFNGLLSKRVNSTIDTVFGTVTQASENVLSVHDSLLDMQNSINTVFGEGGNGTNSVISETQSTIIDHVNIIEVRFREMNDSLANFSNVIVKPAANISDEAKEIIASLENYPQLVNVPVASEVPTINTTSIEQDIDEAHKSIADAIQELRGVRTDVRNINITSIDLSGVNSGINSALEVILDVNDELLGVYDRKNNTKREVQRYDKLRVAIIALTYLLPVIAVALGLLVVIQRSASVGRGWFHFLLVVASISGIFAALYFTLAIVIRDVCSDVDQAVFTGIRLVEPDYENVNWYKEFEKYYPVVTTCGPNTTLIDLFDIPSNVTDLLHNSSIIVDRYTEDYTDLLKNATDELTASVNSIQSVNYTLLDNSTQTIEKLEGVQAQLTNLTKFGFEEEAFNASLADINSRTSEITATYPNGTQIIYSIFYTSTNISLLDINSAPYNYTDSTYRTDLNTSLNAFWAANDTYTEALNVTAGINANVTRLIDMLETMEESQRAFEALKASVNATADSINSDFNSIDVDLRNLTYNIIPSLLGMDGLWDTIENAARCDYMADAYNKVTHFLCSDVRAATTAYVTTQLIIVLVLLIATFAASFANIAFKFPYKPFKYDRQQDTSSFESDNGELQKMSSHKLRSKPVSFSAKRLSDSDES